LRLQGWRYLDPPAYWQRLQISGYIVNGALSGTLALTMAGQRFLKDYRAAGEEQ
jgi:hypothetical protein